MPNLKYLYYDFHQKVKGNTLPIQADTTRK